jgi:hypothetical protein
MEAFILLKFTRKISEKLKIGFSTEGTIRVDHPVRRLIIQKCIAKKTLKKNYKL